MRRWSAPAWKTSWPCDSGAVVVARRPGVVEQIDGTRIVVRATEETDPTKPGVDIYRLQKFQRSNTSPASTSVRWCGWATGSRPAT